MSKAWGVFMGLVVLSAGLVLVPSCNKRPSQTESEGAKAALQAYVTKSFAVKSLEDRGALEDLLTGSARQRMSGWSDEQFMTAFLDKRRKFERLLVKEVKVVSPGEAVITYELTFSDVTDPKAPARETSKKIATLVRDGEAWQIREVKNLKLLIEYENELSLP